MNSKKIKLIASGDTWIETRAVDQVNALAELEGVERITAFPDLHPGRGIPVGCVAVTRNVIYPHIIGNDMGCGMAFHRLNIPARKVRISSLVKKLEALDEMSGSIGGGNHFAEFQAVESVVNRELFEKYHCDKQSLFLLVHSGSRYLGQQIYRYFIENHQAQKGLTSGRSNFREYMEKHHQALEAAKENRRMIAEDMAAAAGCRLSGAPVCELFHNAVEEVLHENEVFFLHRKGATPAAEGLTVIPGSRGDLTWLVRPVNASIESGWSLPHGAGRKWNRSECKGRLTGKYTKDSIRRPKGGSHVVCKERSLLYEEAPEAYKNIETVISSMEEEGLLERVAALRPVVTYKA